MSPVMVTATAMLQCTFGVAPSTLMVLPTSRVLIEGKPAATITDNVPMMNIPTFGMCSSLGNPSVASATAAAFGVLTPMPCLPVPATPWTPGSPRTTVGGTPVLSQASTCTCAFGGMISVLIPGALRCMAN